MGDATFVREQLGLSVREFQVLDYVRTHRPRLVPLEEINEAVFGRFADPTRSRKVISLMRRKLGPSVLVTVHGFGVRYGESKVVEANPRCPKCSRAVAPYENDWTCFACGAQGSRKQLESADLEVGRAAYAEGSRSGQAWTDEEIAFVVANRDRMSYEQLGEATNRTASAVRGQAVTRGLGPKKYVKAGAA